MRGMMHTQKVMQQESSEQGQELGKLAKFVSSMIIYMWAKNGTLKLFYGT